MHNFEFDCKYGELVNPLVEKLIQNELECDKFIDIDQDLYLSKRQESVKEILSKEKFRESSSTHIFVKEIENVNILVNISEQQQMQSENAPKLFRYEFEDGSYENRSVNFNLSLTCLYENRTYHKICIDTNIDFMTKEIFSKNIKDSRSARLIEYRKIFNKPIFFEKDTYLLKALETGILPHVDDFYEEIINHLKGD